MRRRIRGSVLAAAAIMALAAISMPATAGAATPTHKPKPPHKPRPKLVVRNLTFQSTPSQSAFPGFPSVVLESDGSTHFGITFTIKNIGGAKSHDSYPGIFIGGVQVPSRLVSSIAPGDETTVHKSYTGSFFEGPGDYDVYVCVTTQFSKSCSKPLVFSAIPRRWNVVTFSTGPNSPAFDPFFSAHSVQMTFDFYGTVNDEGGKFLWLATGEVDAQVEIGGDNGCTYHGFGEKAHSPWGWVDPDADVGYLEISPKDNNYSAEVFDAEARFTVTKNCFGSTVDSEVEFPHLATVCLGQGLCPLPEDESKLANSYDIPTGTGNGRFVGQWSFRAALPFFLRSGPTFRRRHACRGGVMGVAWVVLRIEPRGRGC